MHQSRLSLRCVCVSATLTCALPTIACAAVYDVAGDFSPSNNPNGAWSLGYSTSLGGAFIPYGARFGVGGLNVWQNNGGLPAAIHNPTAWVNASDTSRINAGQLVMVTGPSGEYAVARFTVQATGMHSFSAAFVGQTFAAPSSDVHVLLNNSPMFSAFVSTFEGPGIGSGIVSTSLTAGDTIDVAVGFSSTIATTGVAFVVEAVPTPGTCSLFCLGGLMAMRCRRASK